MADDSRVQELLSRWERLRLRGEALSPEELCRDCPELLPELRRQLARLEGAIRRPEPSTEIDPRRSKDLDRPPEAPVPAALGRYHLEELIGEGGFGQVWRAFDPELRRAVAIKVPRRKHLAHPERLEAFLAEARKVARLEHPAILPVYDVGRQGDTFFVVARWAEGGDLARRVEAGRLLRAEAVALVAAVADALHFAHLRGLVHRDVKPANILLDSAGQPLLADFGLAVTEEELHAEAPGVLGTLPYMSPEQARGESHHVDGRADVWGLGVILYELLTGRRPFSATTWEGWREQILHREPRPPRSLDGSIPRELERICLRCLEKAVSRRYSTAADLAEDLRRCGPLAQPQAATLVTPPYPAAADPAPTLTALDFDAEVSRLGKDFVGRSWLDEELRRWLGRPDSRVFLLTGDPGTGKSAYLAHVAGAFPQVAARHFCVASLAESLDPLRFVQSLAAQLAARLPDYRRALEELTARATETDPGTLLRRLVADPLRVLEPGWPALVVVDALDEAALRGGRQTLARLLAERLDDLPGWVRLLASTRKDPEVLDLFGRARVYEIEAARPENLRDLVGYLRARLAEPAWADQLRYAAVDPEALVSLICAKSEGNFLYAVQALEAIQSGRLDPRRAGDFPEGLAGVYQEFFERLFPGRQGYESVRPLLDVLTAAREPLSAEQLAGFLGRDEFEVADALQRLAVFFAERGGRYRACHRSLTDWLCGSGGRSRAYRVNLRGGHRAIGRRLLEAFRAGRRDAFLLRHLPAHLLAGECWDELEGVLTDLTFIEARGAAGLTPPLLADYRAALAAWPGHEPYDPFDLPTTSPTAWASACTAAIAAGEPAPHSDRGTGPVVARLALLSPDERLCKSGPGRYAPGEALPAHHFSAAPGEPAACARTRLATSSQASTQTADTPAGRVETFATFVGTHGHVLHCCPQETIPLAYNHSAEGVVASRAGALVAARRSPWVERVPRPPALPVRPACLRTLKGHTSMLTGIALTPDGRWVVTASADGTLRAWDAPSGEHLATLEGHEGAVTGVAVSWDGRLAVSAGQDRTVRVWDLASRACIGCLAGHTDQVLGVSLTPDGALAVSAARDRTLRLWRVASGECLRPLPGHTGKVNAAALTPDGRLVVSAGWDYSVRAWDVASGECLRILRGHAFSITGIACTPDGRLALSGGLDQSLRLWDVAVGECLRVFEAEGHWTEAVALSADGTLGVSGGWDGSLRLWDLAAGECVRSLHTLPVGAVALTPDGRLAATAHADLAARVWDLQGVAPPVAVGHRDLVFSCAWTADGGRAVSASRDMSLRVWDCPSGQCLRVLEGHTSWVRGLSLAADGRTGVSSGWDGTIRVWDLSTGACLQTLKAHATAASDVAVTLDGRRAVSVGHDRTLRLWGLDTGTCVRVLGGQGAALMSVALAADGRLAVAGGQDGSVQVWDVEAGECVRVLHGHRGWVGALVLAPDGRTALSAGRDGTVRVWDVRAGRCLQTLTGHTDEVLDVALAPEAGLVLSAGADSTVHVWELASGKCVAVYQAGAEVCAVSPLWPGGRFACGTEDGQLHSLVLRNLV